MIPPPEVDEEPAADTADEDIRLEWLLVAVLVDRRGFNSRSAPALVLANSATNSRSIPVFF